MANLLSTTTVGGHSVITTDNVGTHAITSLTDTLATVTGRGATTSTRIDLGASESMRLYGIRGQFTGEYMHLYNKVGVGHPNGWGQGNSDTPNYGLSTYGGINIAYGNSADSIFNGKVGIGTNSPAQKLEVNGGSSYPDIRISATGLTSRYLEIGMDGAVQHSIGAFGAGTYLTFKTVGTDRMIIDASGNIGIGTSSPAEKLDVSGNIKATGTAYLPVISDSEYINAGDTNWRTKKFVRSLGISGADIANTWVHLSTVSISGSYDKATLKFKINGYDDVSSGNESIDVRYENGASAQEGHNCRWYTTDNFANIFSEVRSIRSSSSGLSNTYDLYVKMAGDWRDNFTVEVEYWKRNASISFPTTNATATTPTAGSNDIARTLREWHTNNTYVQSNSFISTGMAYAGSGYQHWGDGGTGMVFPSNDNISFQTNSSDRLYINSSGNIGIGTTSPVDPLHIVSSGNDKFIRIENTSAYTGLWMNDSGTNNGWLFLSGYTNTASPGDFAIREYGVQTSLTIKQTTGNVGIGTTSPAYKLDVEGAVRAGISSYRTSINGDSSGANISFGSTSDVDSLGIIGAYGSKFNISSGNGDISFQFNNTERMRIASNGNVGIGTTSPGSKLHSKGEIRVDYNDTDGSTYITGYGIEFERGSNYLRPRGADGTQALYLGAADDSLDWNNINFKTSSHSQFRVAGSDVMRINSTGVGIGTTSPSAKLEVNGDGSNTGGITLRHSTNQVHYIYTNNNYQINRIGSSSPIWRWGQEGGSDKMTLNNTGLGIGTISPTQKLHVTGNVRIDDGYTLSWGGDTTKIAGNSSSNTLSLKTNSTDRLFINSSGNVGIGTTTDSGDKLKVSGNISSTGPISVNNRTAVSVAHWSSVGASTGAIRITLPGSHGGNWSMVVLRITAYEYNSSNHTIYYVSGHDWTTGWYQNGVTKMGDSNKDISLGYDSNDDYVILGGVSSTWSYGHVTVDVVAHPSFYSSSMNIGTGWSITQTTSLSGITVQQVNNRKVLTNADEGSGNGIDADTVDGIQASSFLRSNADDSYSGNITATAQDWYLWGLGARGASAGQYGIGNRNDDSYRQLTFHVPDQAAYGSSGTIPSFGWYSNGAVQLMRLDSAIGDLWLKGDATIEGSISIGDGVTLSESTDRPDLLMIKGSTGSWGGLQVSNTSNEGIISLMINGNEGGLYDDQNGEWILKSTENGGLTLGYDNATKLLTVSDGVNITGRLYASSGIQVPYGPGEHRPMVVLSGAINYGLFHTEATNDKFTFDFNGDQKFQFSQDGIFTINGNTITTGKVTNWDTAYGWGDHASAGYITSLSGYATTSYVDTAVSNLVDSAPGTLDTLNELAAALGDDANFSTTVTNSIATKLPLAGGTLTGDLQLGANQLLFTASNVAPPSTTNQHAGTRILLYPLTLGKHYAMGVESDNMWFNSDGGYKWYNDSQTIATLSASGVLYVNGGNSGQWNTAYSWGNHASAGYLTSFDITTQTDPKYLRSDANDTKTGDTTFTGKVTLQTNLVITESAPTISLLDTDSSADDFYIHVNSNNFYVLRDTDGLNTVDGGWDTPHPLQLEGDTNIGYLFASRIFADNYHPNADKWTTARTLSLTGDVTGSVSWDGSGNASITTVVADDSHNHTLLNLTGSIYNGSYTDSIDLKDHSARTWFRNQAGGWVFQSGTSGDDWTQSFTFYLPAAGSTANNVWAEFGQRDSNDAAAGRYRGLRIVKDTGSVADGDLRAGAIYIGTTRKDQNWDTAYSWGNHSSAGYLTGITSSDVTTALGYTPYQESTALSATTGTFSGDITVNGNQVITSGSNADVKFSVWSGTTYGIGMTSGVTYGGLNDYAMTFCMNNDSDRGFWWGYSGQSKSSGAMSLTTSGHLTVEDKITTSKSEIDFTPTSDTIALDIRGTGTPNDYFTVSNATGGANDVFLPIFFYKAATYGYNGGTNRYTSGVYGGGFVAAVDDTSYPNAAGAGAAMHFNARTYANNGPLTSRYLFSWGSWLTTHMAMTAGGNLLIGKTSDNGEKFQVNGNAHISGNLNVDGTITGYAPSSHTHVISDITSLQSTLDGKQAQGLLDRNGLITTQDWNSFYTDDTLRVTSAHNFTTGANNAPDYSYNYGAALTYRRTSNEAFQMYFPENNGNSTNGNRRVAFRTGWNGGWSSWRRFVDMIDNVGYVTGGNDTGFEVHSDVGYNQDPGTYFLLRGQADNNQPYALKILLTGNASGNDIEWRRLKMNGADDRMYYAPEGQDQITFEYTVVTPSDARLKDNVKNISNPIEKLSKLNGCEFDWNSGVHEGKHDIGVIAQEVEAVIPEAVGEGSDGIKSVAYDKLVPLLIESVKEQQAMIEELKQEIQNLKNK